VEGINIDKEAKLNFCEGRVQGKQHKETFLKKGRSCVEKLLELIHTNVWGPTKTPSFGRARYFVFFIDAYSRKSFIYILKSKGKCFFKIPRVQSTCRKTDWKKDQS
jgi:hypothetical protein